LDLPPDVARIGADFMRVTTGTVVVLVALFIGGGVLRGAVLLAWLSTGIAGLGLSGVWAAFLFTTPESRARARRILPPAPSRRGAKGCRPDTPTTPMSSYNSGRPRRATGAHICSNPSGERMLRAPERPLFRQVCDRSRSCLALRHRLMLLARQPGQRNAGHS